MDSRRCHVLPWLHFVGTKGRHTRTRRTSTRVPHVVAIALATLTLTVSHAQDNSDYASPSFDAEHAGSYAMPHERVDTFSGGLTIQNVDIMLPGPDGFDLEIIRSYSSKIWQWDANHFVRSGEETPLGIGWRMDMGRLYDNPDATDPTPAYVLQLPGGRHIPFYNDSVLNVPNADWVSIDGAWSLRDDVNCLEETGTCLVATSPTGVEYQFPDNFSYRMDPNDSFLYVRTIRNPAKNKTITVTYDFGCNCNEAYIDFITDSYGRVVDFHYTTGSPAEGTCSLDPNEPCFDDIDCTDYCAGAGSTSCTGPQDCAPGHCSDDSQECDNQFDCDRNCSNDPGQDCDDDIDCGQRLCSGGQDNGYPCTGDGNCDNVCQGGADPGSLCNTWPYTCPGLCGPGPNSGDDCDDNGDCGKYCDSGPSAGNSCFSPSTCQKWCTGGSLNGQACLAGSVCPNLCENGKDHGTKVCTNDIECTNWCVGGPMNGVVGCSNNAGCANACSATGIPCSPTNPLACPGANNDCIEGICDIGRCTNIGTCITPNCTQSICSGLGNCNIGTCPPGATCLPQPTCDFPACLNSVCQSVFTGGKLDRITVSWVGGTATYEYTVDETSFVEPVLDSFQTPTSETWSYAYTPGAGDASYDLELKLITLPTGGTISYTYDTHQFFYPLRNSGNGFELTRVVTSKSFGGGTWTYDWPDGQPDDLTTVVVDPMGNTHRHTYLRYTNAGSDRIWKAGLLDEYEVVDGGQTLLRETYTYVPVLISNDNVSNKSGYFESAQIGRMTEKVTVQGSRTSRVRWGDHDKYGNAAWMEEHGWNGLYRTIEYEYTAGVPVLEQAHIVNQPTLVRTLAGTSTTVAEVTSTYCTTNSGTCALGKLDETDTSTGSGTITTSYEYDGDGSVSEERISGGADSRTKTFDYDWGTLKSVDIGGRTLFTRNIHQASGLVLSETNANGHLTSYGWDQWGRLTSINPPGSDPMTTLNYGTTVITLTRGGGQSRYTFDLYGRMLQNRTRIDGSTYAHETKTYNALGQVSSKCELSHSSTPSDCTSYTYDALGRMLTANGPDGNVSFSQSPDTVVISDGISSRTVTRDAFGRFTQVTEGSAGTTTYGWDHLDNLTTVNGPTGSRSFVWNRVGWLLTETHPETGTITYGYNGIGDQTSRTDADSETETYDYDAEGRQTSVDRPGTDNDVVYYYDGDPVPGHSSSYTNASGHLTGVLDSTGSTVWSDRDANGNVERIERKQGSEYVVTDLSYVNGDLATIEYPYIGGSTRTLVSYGNNDAGLVETISVNGSPIVDLIEYNPLMKPDAWHYSNGVTVNAPTSTSERNRPTSIYTVGATLDGNDADVDLDFNYNGRGQVTSINRNGALETYTYEPSRAFLASVSFAVAGSISYGHDAGGNITSRSSAAFPQLNFSRTHGNNRILGCGYSASGNLTSCGGRTYTYWTNNKIRVADGLVQFSYDGNDRLNETLIIGENRVLADFHADQLGRLSRFEKPAGGSLTPVKDWIYAEGQVVATVEHSDECCTPTTCELEGAECGTVPDGCGIDLECGGCPINHDCVDNVCECQPQSCADQNVNCGSATDGCGNPIYCGSCGGGGGGGCVINHGDFDVIQDLMADPGWDDGPGIVGCNGYPWPIEFGVTVDHGGGTQFVKVASTGTILPEVNFKIPVTLSAKGLPIGTHSATIHLTFDDPTIDPVQIPVEFEVTTLLQKAAEGDPDDADESTSGLFKGGQSSQSQSAQSGSLVRWYVADHRGSTLLVLDDTGEVIASYEHFPFGGTKMLTGCPGQDLYQGALGDEHANLYDLGARHQSPDLARFMVPDVVWPNLQVPSGWNLYLYSSNDPVNLVDLLGFESGSATGGYGRPVMIGNADYWLRYNEGATTETPLPFWKKAFAWLTSSQFFDTEEQYQGFKNAMRSGKVRAVDPGIGPGGMVNAGRTAAVKGAGVLKTTIHHILTNKNAVSSARGGPWTPRFAEMARKAGITLENALNKVKIRGHYGPHPGAYHQTVWDRLVGATKGLSGSSYAEAFKAELQKIGKEISTPGTTLNKMVTGQWP